MNRKVMRCVSLLLFLLMSAPLCAQTQTALNEQVKRKVQEMVRQMNDYISYMATPKKDKETRYFYKKQALNLFVGRGYEYEEDGIEKEGVLMEVSSVNRRKPRSRLTRTYFTGLINMSYQAVEIETTKCYEIQVSNLKKIADNEYVCTCDFEQTFKGFRDGRLVYGDKVRKRIKCYVTIDEIEGGVEYRVLLGDTSALETRKL